MEYVTGASRTGVAIVLAIASSACSARSTTPALLRPSPFPTSPSHVPIDVELPPTISAVTVSQTALQFRGVPYVWGGDDPATGFDCSGFVRYVLAQHQVTAPRTAAEQFQLGTRVEITELRAGDLVFFSTVAPGASHVGFAVSSDAFVHAPASSGVVRVEQIGSSYWRQRFVGARRLLLPTARPFAAE